MSFFDTSHLVGLEGSSGPPVGFGEMFSQGFQQQFRVDSARALDDELRNRWLESLRAAQIGDAEATDPGDPWAYRAFSQYVRGETIDTFDPNRKLWDYDPTERIKGMIAANEAIKKLNNPEIKSFEQIFEEVAQMQHEVEGETASMYERSGTWGVVPSLLGAIGGSFTTRDPLNIITAPIGAGRTVATRIAAEMGIAAAVVGATEVLEVAPARKMVGLPERNPLYNIAAATIGAGVIRGGLEGIGYGIRRLRSEDIDFDLRDSQLSQMFEANSTRPSARAGVQALDDIRFIERNNPYGEGQAAHARFMEELRQIQRVMGGEPMTAVARVLPPIPYEQLKKAADFEIVREQAPQVYAKMEAAQAKVAEIEQRLIPRIEDDPKILSIEELAERNPGPRLKESIRRLEAIARGTSVDNEGTVSSYRRSLETAEIARQRSAMQKFSEEEVPKIRKERRAANTEYQAAYRAVEAEAIRIREQQALVEAAQQREAVSIFADATAGRPFNWSALQYDSVQARVDAINAFNDTLDEAAVARFMRETVGEGEEAVEREVWRTDAGIDIGLRDPVDPDFRIATDDGEMTVAAAMRDLQDDADLDDAMRTCLL